MKAEGVQKSTAVFCLASLGGLLLLGFAGLLCMTTQNSWIVEAAGTAAKELAAPRRLQLLGATVLAPLQQPVQLPFGATVNPLLVTTAPSIFDSSDSSSLGSSLEPSKSFDSSLHSSMGGANDVTEMQEMGSVGAGGYGSVGGSLILMLLFACCYKSQAVDPILRAKRPLKEHMEFPHHAEDFENGICGCFDDKWTCIHGLCCPLVRMSHTNAVAGIIGFWGTACALFICGFCFLDRCLVIMWRMELKRLMNIEDHCINDVCVVLCCPHLAICQQAAAVDHEMGYEVTGCCNVDWYDAAMRGQ